jgi:hypothetical protein
LISHLISLLQFLKERIVGDCENLLSEMYRIGVKCVVLSGELSGGVLQALNRLVGSGINVYPPLSSLVRTVYPFIEHQPMAIKFPSFPSPPLKKVSYLIRILPPKRNQRKFDLLLKVVDEVDGGFCWLSDKIVSMMLYEMLISTFTINPVLPVCVTLSN